MTFTLVQPQWHLIAAYTLLSAVLSYFFYILWSTFSCFQLNSRKAALMAASRCLSLFFVASIVPLCIVAIKQRIDSMQTPWILPCTALEMRVAEMAVAFFAVDLLVFLIRAQFHIGSMIEKVMCAHHLVALLVAGIVVGTGAFGASICASLLVTEITSPLATIRILAKEGGHTSLLRSVEPIFTLIFCPLRLLVLIPLLSLYILPELIWGQPHHFLLARATLCISLVLMIPINVKFAGGHLKTAWARRAVPKLHDENKQL